MCPPQNGGLCSTVDVDNQDMLALTAASAPGLQNVCLLPIQSRENGRTCAKIPHKMIRQDRIKKEGAQEVEWGSQEFQSFLSCESNHDQENSGKNRLIVWCLREADVEIILGADEV
jgi:hypothetical protein